MLGTGRTLPIPLQTFYRVFSFLELLDCRNSFTRRCLQSFKFHVFRSFPFLLPSDHYRIDSTFLTSFFDLSTDFEGLRTQSEGMMFPMRHVGRLPVPDIFWAALPFDRGIANDFLWQSGTAA